jgi:hypothetical protein
VKVADAECKLEALQGLRSKLNENAFLAYRHDIVTQEDLLILAIQIMK